MVSPMTFPILTPEQANPLGYGLRQGNEILSGILKNRYLPQQLQYEVERARLANAMSQENLNVLPERNQLELQGLSLGNQKTGIENQYLPQSLQSQIDLRNAQVPNIYAATRGQEITNQYLPDKLQAEIAAANLKHQLDQLSLNHPGLGAPGPAGMLALSDYIRSKEQQASQKYNNPDNGNSYFGANDAVSEQKSLSSVLEESAMRELKKQREELRRTELLNDTRAWRDMPIDYKSELLAQARSFGYPTDEAEKLLSRGTNISELAIQKGFDAEPSTWPPARYPANRATVTRRQRSDAALAGLAAVQPEITEALAPYSNRFFGYSFDQIMDSLKGTNVDQQAKFYAANAIGPELGALRINAQGGNVGEGAIKRMIDVAQMKVQGLQGTLSPEVWTRMNAYVEQWIERMNEAENEAVLNFSKPKLREQGTPKIDFKSPATEGGASNSIRNDKSTPIPGLMHNGRQVTEEDIQATMQANGMTREKVMMKLRGSR